MKKEKVVKMFPVSLQLLPDADKDALAEAIATMIGTGTYTEADIEGKMSSVAGADPAECKAAATKIFKASKAKEKWAGRRAKFGAGLGATARIAAAVVGFVGAVAAAVLLYLFLNQPTPVSKQDVVDATTGFATSEQVKSATGKLATKDDVASATAGLAITGEADEAVMGLLTQDDLTKAVAGLKSDIDKMFAEAMPAPAPAPAPVQTAPAVAAVEPVVPSVVAPAPAPAPVAPAVTAPAVAVPATALAKSAVPVLADCFKEGIVEDQAYACCLALSTDTQRTECRITVRSLVKIASASAPSN